MLWQASDSLERNLFVGDCSAPYTHTQQAAAATVAVAALVSSNMNLARDESTAFHSSEVIVCAMSRRARARGSSFANRAITVLRHSLKYHIGHRGGL
jgi:hypothetical protein